MANSNYPTSLDTTADLPDNITDSSTLDSPDHATLHNVISDAVIAVETKLGTGSSTPVASTLLRGTGTGTTAYAQANLTTDVTGTLPVANGGTGITALGTGVATFLGTPTSANLAAAMTDETGSGSLVFGTNPTLGGATITDGDNVVLGSTTGTEIGTATSQKLGFYGATPVVQQGATTDLGTVLSNTGLRASGTAYPITTSGALNLSGTWTNNTVPANALATSAITLGYAQITTDFTTTSGTYVQVTGLTVTVTIPAGGRRIKITAFTRDLYNATANSYALLSIWDGTVGSGTQLSEVQWQSLGTDQSAPAIAMAVVTPSAGSKTYNVGLKNAVGGTAGLEAFSNAPAFILVEAI